VRPESRSLNVAILVTRIVVKRRWPFREPLPRQPPRRADLSAAEPTTGILAVRSGCVNPFHGIQAPFARFNQSPVQVIAADFNCQHLNSLFVPRPHAAHFDSPDRGPIIPTTYLFSCINSRAEFVVIPDSSGASPKASGADDWGRFNAFLLPFHL
jgi:hypothetical protein